MGRQLMGAQPGVGRIDANLVGAAAPGIKLQSDIGGDDVFMIVVINIPYIFVS